MDKELYVILDHINPNLYSNVTVSVPKWSDVSVENVLGFYSDFDYQSLIRKELVHTLPQKSIKLYFNLCYFPDLSPIIWIDDETKNKINTDRYSYLWMFSPHEAAVRYEELFEIVKYSGVRPEKIIFSNSSEEFNNKLMQGIKFINVVDWWEAHYRHQFKTFSNISFILPEERLKSLSSVSKKALSLNRNLKGHRIWWYHSLLDTKLIDESYVSYHLPRIAKKENYSDDDFKSWIRQECKRLPPDVIESIVNDTRIYENKELDIIDSKTVINCEDTILPYYHDSCISIVTESLDDQVFLTEKTFKAITHCHPFIIVGNEGMQEKLKANGYKTYESFFGMKTVKNYADAKKLIKKLGEMPIEKYQYLIKERYWDTIEYNWNHFMTREISWKSIKERLLRAAT